MEDAVTPAKEEDKKPDLAPLRRMFEEASDLTKDARVQCQKDGDYYHGHQLTTEEKAALAKRRQPDGIFNRVRPAVEGMLGILKQGATDPRAYPRNPQDEDAADVASKVLRFIADRSHFDDLKLRGARDYFVQGTCAAIVEVDEDRQINVEPIRWEEFFYDPRSRREDFKDARYMGVAKWRYADEVAADYPDAKAELELVLQGGIGAVDDTFEDRPTDSATTVAWVDSRKRRVMVVEIYYQEGGQWLRCCFHAGGVLASGPSAYLDEKKRPANPIEAQSCYVDRENNRYGVVRDMRPVQDEINKRRQRLLFLTTVSQVQGVDAAAIGEDADLVRKEAARPDGVIPFGYQKVPTTDMAAGQSQLLAEAKSEIERMGPAPDILGRQSADASGRAQLIRQQAGMTQFAMVFGGIENWELRLYRQMWNRARQFWTAPQFIRVTDDEGSPEFIGVNQPPAMPLPDGRQVQGQFVGMYADQGKPVFQMPDGSMALGYENALAEMDVDITIDATPDTANVQQEQFSMLADLAKVYPQDVTFDDLLEVSAMPNKRQILERRKAKKEEAGQQQNPAMELQMRGAMAELAKTESETALNQAKTQSELAKPHLEAAKLQQQQSEHLIDLSHDAAKTQASMAQQDNHFQGQQAHAERMAAMTPPPGE